MAPQNEIFRKQKERGMMGEVGGERKTERGRERKRKRGGGREGERNREAGFCDLVVPPELLLHLGLGQTTDP